MNKSFIYVIFFWVNYVINKSQNATTRPYLNTRHLLAVKIMLPKNNKHVLNF
jgi:hypothetical protein